MNSLAFAIMPEDLSSCLGITWRKERPNPYMLISASPYTVCVRGCTHTHMYTHKEKRKNNGQRMLAYLQGKSRQGYCLIRSQHCWGEEKYTS